ncbi:MAG: glycosyltransferase family 4 protein [Bacteroidota bacterium]
MQARPAKILIFYPSLTTFIAKDIEIYQRNFRVSTHRFDAKHKFLTFYRFSHQFFFLLLHIWGTKLIICEFSGYHSFLPGLFGRIWGKPIQIISAGTDCVSFPSFGYGNFSRQPMGYFTGISFRLSHHIAPVHASLMYRKDTYYEGDQAEQGIQHFVKGLKRPFTTIPYGFDPEKWKPAGERIPNSFITVAYIIDKRRFILKGIDLIFKVAPHYPQAVFTVVGYDYEQEQDVPENVNLVPPTPNEEILALYQKHQFYLQLSISEGHPNAICEAMMCGCVPIGSNVTALPDIVGDSGFILKERNDTLCQEVIGKAIRSKKKIRSQKARAHIQKQYHINRRTRELTQLAHNLIRGK